MAHEMSLGKESREAYWRRHVSACEASGVSMAQYCREHGLSYSGCQWWKGELKRRDERRALGAGVPAFAEVQVVAPMAPEALIEIACAGTRGVRVHPGFDEETLARVLVVVERAGC